MPRARPGLTSSSVLLEDPLGERLPEQLGGLLDVGQGALLRLVDCDVDGPFDGFDRVVAGRELERGKREQGQYCIG